MFDDIIQKEDKKEDKPDMIIINNKNNDKKYHCPICGSLTKKYLTVMIDGINTKKICTNCFLYWINKWEIEEVN